MADQEPGFEYKDEFYPWAQTRFGGKDIIIIDRITGMQLDEFQDAITDETSPLRGVTLLAVMGIAMRAKHPSWSPERIYRTMLDLDLGDVNFVGGDDEDPPAEGVEETPEKS